MQKSQLSLSEVLQRHTTEWLQLPGVVGTGEGQLHGKPCILILVNKKSKALAARLPRRLDGYAVVIHETGQVRAL
ncbi:MAG TPA: hypothetical protein VGR15_09905 [Bacteroidota bacterium]|nr:hypothetical protein [Bacteroidota bacterium]